MGCQVPGSGHYILTVKLLLQHVNVSEIIISVSCINFMDTNILLYNEMKGDVGMSSHEKEREQEDAYTKTESHS